MEKHIIGVSRGEMLYDLDRASQVRLPKRQTVRCRLTCRNFIGQYSMDLYLWAGEKSKTGERDKLNYNTIYNNIILLELYRYNIFNIYIY